MNHVSGNIGQSVSNDYGEFITIGDTRMRKDLIIFYCLCPISDDPSNRPFGIKVSTPYFPIGVAIGTKEEAEKEVLRLDWLFKGDKK